VEGEDTTYLSVHNKRTQHIKTSCKRMDFENVFLNLQKKKNTILDLSSITKRYRNRVLENLDKQFCLNLKLNKGILYFQLWRTNSINLKTHSNHIKKTKSFCGKENLKKSDEILNENEKKRRYRYEFLRITTMMNLRSKVKRK